MIRVDEVREKLASVSSGELPLWDFYNWLEEASLNMHQDSSQEAMDLVGRAGVLFAEFDRGNLAEPALLAKLCGLVHLVQIFGRAQGASSINANPLAIKWVAGADWTLLPELAPAPL